MGRRKSSNNKSSPTIEELNEGTTGEDISKALNAYNVTRHHK
jgi:hypothetical protein